MKFWQKNLSTKAACKMLMTLTFLKSVQFHWKVKTMGVQLLICRPLQKVMISVRRKLRLQKNRKNASECATDIVQLGLVMVVSFKA